MGINIKAITDNITAVKPAAAGKPCNIRSGSKGKQCGDIFTPAQPNIMDNAIDRFLDGNQNLASRICFHKILNEQLPKIMTPENFINNGRESKVYKISDNYVAKIRKEKNQNNCMHIYNFAKVPDKKFSKLNIYCGEPLIKCGKVEILRNATPAKDCMPCGVIWKNDYISNESLEKYNKEYLPALSAVPQESYDEFAQNLKILNGITTTDPILNEISYTPDIINPNNLIISGNKFKLVDKMEKTVYSEPNSLFTMIGPMILRYQPDYPAVYDPALSGLRTEIFRKALVAAEKTELPLDGSCKDQYDDWVLSDITHVDTIEVLKKIQSMRDKGSSVEERIKFINDTLQPDKK